MKTYEERIADAERLLADKTLSEVEDGLGINEYEYEGVGFGYQLKKDYPENRRAAFEDMQNNSFTELLELSARL